MLYDLSEFILANNPSNGLPYHGYWHLLEMSNKIKNAIYYYNLGIKEADQLLAAAWFHDFNHSGGALSDAQNIERAVEGWKQYCNKWGYINSEKVIQLIRSTQFPHQEIEETLEIQILRDADTLPSLDVWRVINGLAKESGISFEEMLQKNYGYIEGLTLRTGWANEIWKIRKPLILAELRVLEYKN